MRRSSSQFVFFHRELTPLMILRYKLRLQFYCRRFVVVVAVVVVVALGVYRNGVGSGCKVFLLGFLYKLGQLFSLY